MVWIALNSKIMVKEFLKMTFHSWLSVITLPRFRLLLIWKNYHLMDFVEKLLVSFVFFCFVFLKIFFLFLNFFFQNVFSYKLYSINNSLSLIEKNKWNVWD